MDFKVRDFRKKGFFTLDDAYLNGYARYFDPTTTAVYLSLCRHVDKEQKCFPSQELIAKEHGINPRTVRRKLKLLEIANIIRYKRIRSKSGKWLHNTYYLLDKSEWKQKTKLSRGHRSPMVKPQDTDDKTTGHPRPLHKVTHIEEDKKEKKKNKKERIRKKDKKDSLKKEKQGEETLHGINDLIELFKEVNPSYKRLFSNRGQRSALERMVREHGFEEIKRVIESLPAIISRPYAPQITTPYQLELKLGDLLIYMKREGEKKNEQRKKFVTV